MTKRLLLAVILIVLSATGCTFDMNLPNNNEPDSDRVLAFPSEVENLIGSAFREYWFTVNGHYPGEALSAMADEKWPLWGQWGMKDLGWEPRQFWNNSPDYRYAEFTEVPWFGCYDVISNVNAGMNAILEGMEIGGKGSTDTKRVFAFGKFCQGVAHGYLGLFFNKGIIYPEGMDLEEYRPEFVHSSTLIDESTEQLSDCIVLCEESSFTLPARWINGITITNEDLARLCHSFIARYMVHESRTAAQRAAVDWSTVLFHIDRGITEDFSPEGDNNMWWHPVQYSSGWKDWFFVNNRLIGPSDTSDNYRE
ncbi:hypothetical protein ACFL6G_06540 [candidate division KSB1 bacterium]